MPLIVRSTAWSEIWGGVRRGGCNDGVRGQRGAGGKAGAGVGCDPWVGVPLGGCDPWVGVTSGFSPRVRLLLQSCSSTTPWMEPSSSAPAARSAASAVPWLTPEPPPACRAPPSLLCVAPKQAPAPTSEAARNKAEAQAWIAAWRASQGKGPAGAAAPAQQPELDPVTSWFNKVIFG